MEGRCLAAAALNCNLIRLFSTLFSSTLSRQRFFHALLLSRFEVEGVTPDLLDDVFLLYLAFEPTKGILQRLALLQSNFCQSDHLPASNQSRTLELTSSVLRSVEVTITRHGRSEQLCNLTHRFFPVL